eukprot:CAMPEP_0194226758 /NCGR_PEP_ID=MMETSP0156-20130528/42503_1 /TAXON_ID=33649 /ORGANISM="Thalassionema nitzschioides, Strain L26-B" /LENGTH=66 /DNA_ID=CAMNT_0038959215 /DNA_START=1655 /DNA_END=1855 /DNA_ORIENTATION=-
MEVSKQLENLTLSSATLLITHSITFMEQPSSQLAYDPSLFMKESRNPAAVLEMADKKYRNNEDRPN